MRYLITFLIQIACLTALSAQILQVKEAETSQPLSYVSITDQQVLKFTITDQEGRADLSAFQPGDTLLFQIMGFNDIRIAYEDLRLRQFEMTLEPSVFSLDQILISANRWSQRRSNYPGKIRQLNQKEIQFYQPQTAADMLASSGEVFIQKSQMGGGSPMIRGFSANRLLYAVDGVRMNTAIFRSGNVHNVLSLDPFSIESTEIVYGPGSILYGSDAIGAVMAFQTKAPEFSTNSDLLVKGNTELRLSSANEEFTGHLDLNLGTKKWAFLTSITGNQFGDLKMGSHGPEEYLRHFRVANSNGGDTLSPIDDPRIQVPTAYDQFYLLQKIAYQASPFLNIDYAFHFSRTTNIPRYDRLIQERDEQPRFAEWYYGPQKWMMNHLSLEYTKPSKYFDRMRVVAAQQSFETTAHAKSS
ncbi:MAG: TonB-dependent receptor plug domain-containing protein, partial [Bacteroidota bacterium]